MKIPMLRSNDTFLISIHGDLTDQDALDFQCDVLHAVRESEIGGIVIDITALDVVDSFMARVLNETATMARLLGAEVVLCGMQPSVALTLIEMGRQLIGVEMALNLDQGIDKLHRLLGERGRGHG